ncbi:NIPSNAP family protein [Nitrospinota bacterium]
MQFPTGSIRGVIEAWAEIIEERKEFSPIAACWYTDVGPLNQWVHVWPYADLNERDRVRAEQGKIPGWPPKTCQWMVSQENRLVVSAPCSPMRWGRTEGQLRGMRILPRAV